MDLESFRVVESRVVVEELGELKVAVDEYLEVYVNGSRYSAIVLNPAHLEETVVGVLLGDGIVESRGG
ncbi:MAG: hypothetical protein QXS85_01950 [Acidilobaceae archaeon]